MKLEEFKKILKDLEETNGMTGDTTILLAPCGSERALTGMKLEVRVTNWAEADSLTLVLS